VSVRVYAELNDFLPKALRGTEFPCPLNGGPSLKHVVESLGIPHTEIELLVVNGISVGLDHQLEDGDRVAVYPVFESLDLTPLIRLRPGPLRDIRFILDVHLGKLALLLRLLGFDAAFPGDIPDAELARISSEERRVLLTRDTMLLKRSSVTHGCYIHSLDPEEQTVEILQRLDLHDAIRPFSRCPTCGAPLADVEKEQVLDRLEPLTKKYYHRFRECTRCGQIYWKGSHFEALLSLLGRLGVEPPADV
jgi:uncharacterized protein